MIEKNTECIDGMKCVNNTSGLLGHCISDSFFRVRLSSALCLYKNSCRFVCLKWLNNREYISCRSLVGSMLAWLVRREATVQIPSQTTCSKRKIKKKQKFFRRFPLSRFLITLRVNKYCNENFHKQICRSASSLNCRLVHLCIKLLHDTSGVRS